MMRKTVIASLDHVAAKLAQVQAVHFAMNSLALGNASVKRVPFSSATFAKANIKAGPLTVVLS